MVSRYFAEQEVNGRIRFTFDQQDGVDDDISLFQEFMLRSMPKNARRLIDGTPGFTDDKSSFGLQAADLLACELRLKHEGKFVLGSKPVFDSIVNPRGHLTTEINDASLAGWGSEFAGMPALTSVQSKIKWRKLKRQLRSALSLGYRPPYGTRWRNVIYGLRDWIRRE